MGKVTVECHVMDPDDREKYPEHARMEDATTPEPTNNAIGDFLDWLFSEGYFIAARRPLVYQGWQDDELREHTTEQELVIVGPPRGPGIEGWLATYLDIDLAKLNAEKQAMLEMIRESFKKKKDADGDDTK